MKMILQPYFVLLLAALFLSSCEKSREYRKISLDEYRDKMKAAWVGQMAGVGWGLPTEFDYTNTVIPREETPVWTETMINQHGNDDIYVEMTFLSSMGRYGRNVSVRQAGIDFANSGYTLWAANKSGRENLRFGIAPPESSHPAVNSNCEDIDYQIEADFSGIIAPGMPTVPVMLGEKFGRLMNYGDGMYAGQFVGGMYSAAYFESDIREIIRQGLACIPSESNYAQVVNDVMDWHQKYPDNWKKTWQLIEEKYHKSYQYQPFARQNEGVWIPIDAKINGAYIVMGLLYGNGDMDSTILISMRCGKDSDCNPSNAAGILATTIGYENLPQKFKTSIDWKRNFSYADFNFEELLTLCEDLTRGFVRDAGGKISENEKGEEFFYIPRMQPEPSPFQPSYDPGPFDEDNKYNRDEMSRILAYSDKHFRNVRKILGKEIHVYHCGKESEPALVSWNDQDNVLPTSFMNLQRSLVLEFHPEEFPDHVGDIWFRFLAGNDPGERYRLKVQSRGKTFLDTVISGGDTKNWTAVTADISELSGTEDPSITIIAEPVDSTLSKQYWANFRIE